MPILYSSIWIRLSGAGHNLDIFNAFGVDFLHEFRAFRNLLQLLTKFESL